MDKKYYRIYFEDVDSGLFDTRIFSAASKANALELFNESFFGCNVIAIKIITPELMERYGLTDESEVYRFHYTGEDEDENCFESPCNDFVGTLDEAVKHGQEVANETGLIIYVNSSNAIEDVLYPEKTETESKSEVFDRFANVKFADDTHKQLFLKVLKCMRVDDLLHETFAYLITLDVVCRKHIDSAYDFREDCIKSECLSASWHTSTSIETTLLAFNLFTFHANWCPDDIKWQLMPDNIFRGEYAPYYWEAIKILNSSFWDCEVPF